MKHLTIDTKHFFMHRYAWFATGVYALAMLHGSIRPGVFIAVLILMLFFSLIIKRKMVKVDRYELLILLYIFWNIISYLWISTPGFGFSSFVGEAAVSILPILLFFCTSSIDKDIFYKNTLNAIVVCVLIGLVLYLLLPSFYLNYLYRYGFSYSNLPVHARQGFSSYIGRIAMGTYTVYGVAIGFKLLKKEYSLYYLFCIMVCGIGCILSSQRSAWVGAAVLLIFELYLFIKKRRLSTNVKMVGLIFCALPVAFIAISKGAQLGAQVLSKSLRVADALSERVYTWSYMFASDINLLTGKGLGTVGHKANEIGLPAVTDGGLVKILLEIGVIGLLLFTMIVIIAVKSAWKDREARSVELFAVLFMILQSIGSNVLALQITAPIFWISVGFLRNKDND